MVPAPPEAISGTWHTSRTFFQLFEIVAVTHAVLVHHIEDDFTCAKFLHLFNPVERFPLSDAGTAFITGVLINVILPGFGVMPYRCRPRCTARQSARQGG